MKRITLSFLSAIILLALVLGACAPQATATPAADVPADGYPATDAGQAAVDSAEGYPAADASADATIVRVATDATFAPFDTIDENTKELAGFDIDLMNAIAAKANLKIEWTNTGFDALETGIGQCQYDAVISAMTITDARKNVMLFSDPYTKAGQILTVRIDEANIKTKDDLGGHKVGAQLGTTGAIEAEKIDGAELKTYDSYDLAFVDLMNGQIDGVIVDNPTAIVFVQQYSDKLKTTGDVFTDEAYGIGVCKTMPELVDKINAGLAEVVKDGTMDQLNAKWLEVK
jgi:polar amino acid transport system substrate-binding protein